jgi:transposase-like protein
LVSTAKEQGVALTVPDGLLKQLTKTAIETALNEELGVAFGRFPGAGWSYAGKG